MSDAEHPLNSNCKWEFTQPTLRVDVACKSTDMNDKHKQAHIIHAHDDCRETVASYMRDKLRKALTKEVAPAPGRPNWETNIKETRKVDLVDHVFPKNINKGHVARLGIDCGHAVAANNLSIDDLFKVSDSIAGNVAVLLNPGRATGEWWRSEPELDDSYAMWNGADNFFLFHPVLATTMLGLYRQAYHLCRAGAGEQVLKDLPYTLTEEAMTNSDYGLAKQNVRALRRWIEVPVARDGEIYNYPFPKGMWLRFMRLHQAMHKYDASKVFDGAFEKGWNLVCKDYEWDGSYSYWGLKGDDEGTSEHYERLLDLGRPVSKEKKNDKPPAKSTGK